MTTKKTNNKFWSMKAENNEAGSVGHIYLYDVISSTSWWGDEVTPKTFREDLDALGEVNALNVHIFSDGGDVFAGNTIYSLLKQYDAEVNVYIEGCAASIATVIAMAGDNVYISKIGMMMIHNPLACLWGYYNKDNLNAIISDLEKVKEPLVAAYLSHMDKDRDEIIDLMNGKDGEGTWFSASEAIEAGLADQYIPEESDEVLGAVACTGLDKYEWNGHSLDLSKYKNAPKLINYRKEKKKMAKGNFKPKAEETTETTEEVITVTCPECEHEFDLDNDTEETTIDVTCESCGHKFKWDVETGKAVEETEENEDEDNENEDTKAHFQKGIKAERNRINALNRIKSASPQYSDIVDKAIDDGSSYTLTSKKVFEAMAKDKGDNTPKGFIDSQKKESAGTKSVGALPNSGNQFEAESEDDAVINSILTGMKNGR